MQTKNFPIGYTLVTGQAQHWNNDSAPLLRRQAAFCGSVDDRILSGPQQNINAPPLSQNLLSATDQAKIPQKENIVTPFNINAQQGYSRQPQIKAVLAHETLPKPVRQLHRQHSCPPTQNGQLPGSVKCNKADFVESLVDVAAMIIESIWPNHSASTKTKILPLRVFIRETLQRSRTSFSTLQTALFYLFRVKDLIPRSSGLSSATKDMGQASPPISPIISVFDIGVDGIVRPATAFPFPSPPLTPAQVISHGSTGQDSTLSTKGKSTYHSSSLDPVYCARRMFLASLIVASKFLQDKNYSNKAWAKITGLSSSEINHNEIAFLRLIDYRLFVPPPAFARWSSMLINYINHSQIAKAANTTRGDANDLSNSKPSIVAQFNSESNIINLCKNASAESSIAFHQMTTSILSSNTSICINAGETLDRKCTNQHDAPTIGRVNMMSSSISEAGSSNNLVSNCLLSESRMNSIQNASAPANNIEDYTHQFESSEPSYIQQTQVDKVRYVRECIGNIRNQQSPLESKERYCQSRNSTESTKFGQNRVRPPLGYRCKSHIEFSPYPTTTLARSKTSSQLAENKHDLCPNQSARFLNSSPSPSLPSLSSLDKLCKNNPRI